MRRECWWCGDAATEALNLDVNGQVTVPIMAERIVGVCKPCAVRLVRPSGPEDG